MTAIPQSSRPPHHYRQHDQHHQGRDIGVRVKEAGGAGQDEMSKTRERRGASWYGYLFLWARTRSRDQQWLLQYIPKALQGWYRCTSVRFLPSHRKLHKSNPCLFTRRPRMHKNGLAYPLSTSPSLAQVTSSTNIGNIHRYPQHPQHPHNAAVKIPGRELVHNQTGRPVEAWKNIRHRLRTVLSAGGRR